MLTDGKGDENHEILCNTDSLFKLAAIIGSVLSLTQDPETCEGFKKISKMRYSIKYAQNFWFFMISEVLAIFYGEER